MIQRRHGILFVQAAGSLLVLALLIQDAEWGRIWGALEGVGLGWLLAAMGAKALGVTAREVRLWVSLRPWGAPPFPKVLSIGYATGLVNNVVPARGGDLLGAALLRAECGVPGAAALAAVGITSVVEALVFGVFLLILMATYATRWQELLGPGQVLEAIGGLTLLTLVAVFGAVGAIIVGRRLQSRAPPPDAPEGGAVRAWLKQAVVETGRGFSAAGPLALNAALALVQVGCMVGCYALLFPALGLDPPLPLLAASFVVAVGSLAAVVLPPSMAAGGAATSVAVLSTFHIEEPQALAFGALIWLAHMIPIIALGAGPLWVRLGRLPGRQQGGAPETR